MTLLEALKLIKQPTPPDAPPFDVFLACGGTPLHIQTFLTGYLKQAFPARAVHMTTGLYGDLIGNIERMNAADPHAGVVLLEWEDLDARLGVRQAGDWSQTAYADILETALAGVDRLRSALGQCRIPVALSLPTLPFAPLWHYPGWQANPLQAQLKERLAGFEHWASTTLNVRVVNTERLARVSPPGMRHDVNSHILNGFPYTQSHTAALTGLLTLLIRNEPPKKALITDLDHTLWAGIVGEIGPDQVSWDLDHRSHMHGVYQRFLSALAQEGVLVGVASKNDASVVERALQRQDMLIHRNSIWPVEANWSAKSGAITRILQAWNIGPESVVFIDDNPMELAEVKAAHPKIDCVLFPGDDYNRILEMIANLRDLFGKSTVTKDDALRLNSLRASAAVREESASGAPPDAFLAAAAARMSLSFANPPETRALELINKTNQFNLNGRRYTESDWQRSLRRPGAVVLTASYQDKFGPLGTILVLHGYVEGNVLFINAWVMSCRAFSRRIEYTCIQQLYEQLGVEEIEFDFVATERNGPLQELFTVLLGHRPETPFRLSYADFRAKCPTLFISVSQTAGAL